MDQILNEIVNFVWGLPLIIFLFLANFYLMFQSKFLPLMGIRHAVSLLFIKEEAASEGQISHFQTFCNAIAATVGLGNISGVAIAITQGGPGVVLWMWVAAIFGMNTKFFEVTTALILRGKDYRGEVQGGAMYSIQKAFAPKFHFLAYLFAVCGVVGTLSMFQVNQLASLGTTLLNIDGWMTGVIFGGLTLWVLQGGLARLSKTCAAIVPVMSLVYIFAALVILIIKFEMLPLVIKDIFIHAFTMKSAVYGSLSYGFIHIMVTGIKRATFSNEAGLGTAPMAHSNSKTSEPISEGYVSMLGPLLDTLIVCTLTALVILVCISEESLRGQSGITLSLMAFESSLGQLGKIVLGISVLLFGYSTILGMANYNEKCWDFLFRGKRFFGSNTFKAWYIGTILLGSVMTAESVISIIDISYAIMTIPNIIITVYMAKQVQGKLSTYNEKYKL